MRAMLASFVCAVGCVMLIAGAQSPTAVRYRATPRGPLSGVCYCCPFPSDINEETDIVGTGLFWDAGFHPFFVASEGEEFSVFQDDGGAYAINARGDFVGVFNQSGAFVWSRESGPHTIPEMIPGQRNCNATDINDLGWITVIPCSTSGNFVSFLWDSSTGESSELGDLPGGNVHTAARAVNNDNVVVGESATGWNGQPASTEAFVWTLEPGIRPLGPFENGIIPIAAFAINEIGKIAGRALLPTTGERFLFVWDPHAAATLIPLDSFSPPLGSVFPSGFNNSATIVGTAYSNQVERAFIWTPGRGLRLLQELRDPCDRSDRHITHAGGINSAGIIAAFDEDRCGSGNTRLFVLTPYLVGDLDADADVDLDDLAVLLQHFGQSGGAVFEDGDLDCDADVDLQDLATLLGVFGETLP